jgi:hypothetical protein
VQRATVPGLRRGRIDRCQTALHRSYIKTDATRDLLSTDQPSNREHEVVPDGYPPAVVLDGNSGQLADWRLDVVGFLPDEVRECGCAADGPTAKLTAGRAGDGAAVWGERLLLGACEVEPDGVAERL